MQGYRIRSAGKVEDRVSTFDHEAWVERELSRESTRHMMRQRPHHGAEFARGVA